MKESKPIYGFHDGNDFSGLVWETELGKVVTFNGKLDMNNDLLIREIDTGKDIGNVDLRNVLMSILPLD